jgi:hypothetical protein
MRIGRPDRREPVRLDAHHAGEKAILSQGPPGEGVSKRDQEVTSEDQNYPVLNGWCKRKQAIEGAGISLHKYPSSIP